MPRNRTIKTDDALRMMKKIGAGGGGGIAQETDPTVPSWAKQPTKPTYTADEVGALPKTTKIPSKTSDLTNDSEYITEPKLTDAVSDALTQAKASGEFDGEEGERGTGTIKITTAPSSYTTAIGSYTPKYRIALSTVRSQGGVSKVLKGDILSYSYYHYQVDYLDGSYAYISKTRVSIRGAAGSDANVTTENITSALGYTPANQTDVTQLSEEIVALDETTAKVTVEEKRVANFTNQIPISTDTDGSIYNGVGYKENTYLNADGLPFSHSTLSVSGFIPCPYNTVSAFGQRVLYFENFDSAPPNTDLRVALYDANKSFLSLQYASKWINLDESNSPTGAIFYKLKSDGMIDYLDLSHITRYFHNNLGEDVAYIRICGLGIDEETIITLNQEITYTEGAKERTLDKTLVIPQCQDLETRLETQCDEFETRIEARLEELESGKSAVPSYIVEEAEKVAKAVQSARTSKTLVFSAMSDIHLYADNTTGTHPASLLSVQSGGKGLKEIQKRMNLDFIALLGDYSYMSSNSYNANQVMNDITLVKETLAISGDKEVWCVGNHDWCYGTGVDRMLTEDELYSHVGANSDGVKPYDSLERCFGYLDFDNQKIRVIYLNTNDCKDGIDNEATTKDSYQSMEMISPTQLRWFADVALDFTNKTNSSEWGIVILSHQPIDYGYAWYTRILELLEAYRQSKKVTLYCADYIKNGTTTGHNETFDFTNIENPAEIICNVHGHVHNCGSAKVSSASSVTPWLWRFCIPNMCANRYNEKYDTKWGEVDESGNRVQWTKETGTAKETSFNIVSIDRKNKKIYAHIFGAGKDRVFSYDSAYVPQEYTINTVMSNCTGASGNPTTITEGLSASLVFTASSGYELPDSVTVSGAEYTWNKSTGTLTLSNPTANVSITIVGVAIVAPYINQIPISTDTDGSVYNGKGYKENTYLSSGNVGTKSGCVTAGFIPIGIGSSSKALGEQVIYLENIEALPTDGNVRIAFYDSSKTYVYQRTATQMVDEATYKSSSTTGVVRYTGADGYINKIDVSGYTAYLHNSSSYASPAFFRICSAGIDGDSIITVNEEIV